MRSFFRERFRAKYFWSAFLVLGVLSVTIGANRLDPLVVKTLAIQDRATKLFDYGFLEGPRVLAIGEEGIRTFLLGEPNAASSSPTKYFPIDPFKKLADAIDAEKNRPEREKQEAAAEPKEDPLKYIRPAPKDGSGSKPFYSNWLPKGWLMGSGSSPVEEAVPPKIPTGPAITEIKWSKADEENLVVIRALPAPEELFPIAKLGAEGKKIIEGLLSDLENSQQMGAVGSFDVVLKEDILGKIMHAGSKRVVALNDPYYVALYKDMQKLKVEIDAESDKRSVYPMGDKRATAVLEAADLYLKTQMEFYANYVRNAHAEDDAASLKNQKYGESENARVTEPIKQIKLREKGSATRDLILGALLSPTRPPVYIPDEINDPTDEAMKTAKAIQRDRARQGLLIYSPDAFESLNLHLHVRTALPLYKEDGEHPLENWVGQRVLKLYNVRHVPDGKGGFQKLELFINTEEKRLIEYAFLSKPASKHAYLKLLQTTAIRERMTNRWSLRRMMSVPISGSYDRKAYACGHDLVSYKISTPTGVDQMENYSTLWQGDRFKDFSELIPKITSTLGDRPLLTKEEYVEISLKYLTSFSEFSGFILEKYASGVFRPEVYAAAMASFISEVTRERGIQVQGAEEASIKGSAQDLLTTYNLPADSITPSGIAERTAWKAFELRKGFIADTLVNLGKFYGFSSLSDDKAMELALSLVEPLVKDRQAKWRKEQSEAIYSAVASAWTPQFASTQNSNRYLEFEKTLLPIASPGARAVQIQVAAEEALKKYQTAPKSAEFIAARKDRYKPEHYIANDKGEYQASRIAYTTLGLKDHFVPVNPDQLSRLFYKKLELLADSDAPKPERGSVERISQNPAVLRFMQGFFAELSGQYQQAIESSGQPASRAPAEAGANISSEKIAKSNEGGGTDLSTVEIDEKNTPLTALLIPATKKTLEDFEKALATPPKKKSPEAGTQRLSDEPNPKMAKFDQLGLTQYPIARSLSDKTAVAKPQFVRNLLGDEEESFYIADEKAREKAKRVLQEAFGLIGLAQVGAGAIAGFHEIRETAVKSSPSFDGMGHEWTREQRKTNRFDVIDSISVERIVQMQVPKAGLLEKMVASFLDQKILANIIENDAYAQAPILAMQNTKIAIQDKVPEGRWDRFVRGKVIVPSLLRNLAKYFNKDSKENEGWNLKNARSEILKHIYTASKNDQGKIEDFCEADLRAYESDEKFKSMFRSITGLREALGSQANIKKWDEEIVKDIRSSMQKTLEDFIDPIGMYILVAFIGFFAWQGVLLALGAGGITLGGGLAGLLGSLGKLTFSRILILMFTGNLAPLQVMFSFQSFAMLNVYCYQLPPQANYEAQVANSQIKTDRHSLVNREKMQTAIGELTSNIGMAKFQVVAEFAQFGGFTAPGVYRTIGLKGTKALERFTKGVDPELARKISNESLSKLIKENGARKGLAIYAERFAAAAHSLNRVSSVSKAATDVDIAKIMVERAAPKMAKREILEALYGRVPRVNPLTGEFILDASGEMIIDSRGILKATEVQVKKAREAVLQLKAKTDALKKSSKWADARAYVANFKYKYGPDEKYFRLIVAKEYEEAALLAAQGGEKVSGEAGQVLKKVMNGKNAREIRLLIEGAKLRDLEYKLAYLNRLSGRLAALGKNEEISVDLVREFLSHLTLADWQMHRSLILDAVRPVAAKNWLQKASGVLSKNPEAEKAAGVTIKFYKELFKDFDYLAQDYKNLNPKMATLARGLQEGTAHLTIDKVGQENILDPKEITEHPEDYEFLTIPLDDL